jgi:hypothetical protein
MSLKRTSSIILHGGLFRVFNPAEPTVMKLTPFNILLKKSNVWLSGLLSIDKRPYYRMTAKRDNRIEIKPIGDNHHVLIVNDTIIFDTPNQQFNYTIDVKLNPQVRAKPYADFFRYY